MNRDATDGAEPALPSRGGPAGHRVARIRRVIAGVLGAVVLVAGIDLAVALLTPSQDSVLARGAEWARSRGLGDLVSAVEWATYQFNPPAEGGAPAAIPADGPVAGRSGRPGAGSVGCATTDLVSPAANPLPDEGAWQPIETVKKKPVIFAAFVRPDARHTSFLAGVTCTDHAHVRFTLHPGTQVPGGTGWAEPPTIADVPPRELLATFNSGFRMDDSRGGFWMAGKSVGSLVPGRASMVFTGDGRLDVRVWEGGRPAPGIVAVRQNLSLLVDAGQVTDAVRHADSGAFGKTLGDSTYVWRSGVGVTANGDIVTVHGNALSVKTLAQLLQRAGCVRAMQLDINRDWTSFIYYDHRGGLRAKKLTSDQVAAATRYLGTSTRDFVSVRSR